MREYMRLRVMEVSYVETNLKLDQLPEAEQRSETTGFLADYRAPL